jgi:hypothetical protein
VHCFFPCTNRNTLLRVHSCVYRLTTDAASSVTSVSYSQNQQWQWYAAYSPAKKGWMDELGYVIRWLGMRRVECRPSADYGITLLVWHLTRWSHVATQYAVPVLLVHIAESEDNSDSAQALLFCIRLVVSTARFWFVALVVSTARFWFVALVVSTARFWSTFLVRSACWRVLLAVLVQPSS